MTIANDDLSKTALLVVDAQPTFMPGGELPVPGGDGIIEPVIALLRARGREFGVIVFSRDWHPQDHCSFDEHPRFEDGSWPVHGLAGSANAEVAPQLIHACQDAGLPYRVVSKGMDKDKEAYSAFDGLDLDDGENLDDILNHAGIVRVFVCGLAGEVCVLASAVAGHDLGYEVTLLPEATAWLGDPQPSSSRMRELGVDIIPSLRVV